jgi:AraC-like DNA-binding protein
MVGYENANHFILLYKKVTGLTPVQYKKNIKSGTIKFLEENDSHP